MFSKLLFTIAAVAVAVNAQSASSSAPSAGSTSTAGISACILACVGPAAQNVGCSFTDPTCVCASAQFVADATACLNAHCTPADVTSALALQASQCGAAGVTPTGSVTTTNSVPFSTPASASSTGSAAPASSAASHSGSASAGQSSAAASASGSAAASATKPATSSTASASAAGVVLANNGVVAVLGAVLAGVLAL